MEGDPINAKFKGRPGRVAKLDPVLREAGEVNALIRLFISMKSFEYDQKELTTLYVYLDSESIQNYLPLIVL